MRVSTVSKKDAAWIEERARRMLWLLHFMNHWEHRSPELYRRYAAGWP